MWYNKYIFDANIEKTMNDVVEFEKNWLEKELESDRVQEKANRISLGIIAATVVLFAALIFVVV